jgi:hypothetical protein
MFGVCGLSSKFTIKQWEKKGEADPENDLNFYILLHWLQP